MPLPADDVAALQRLARARGIRHWGELVRLAVEQLLERERSSGGPLFASSQRSLTYYRPIAPPIGYYRAMAKATHEQRERLKAASREHVLEAAGFAASAFASMVGLELELPADVESPIVRGALLQQATAPGADVADVDDVG